MLSLARSGGVFYGGLICAVGVAFWYIQRHDLPFWTTCDAFAPAMALGMAVGRIGDYLSAEDGLGKPTTLPWAVPVPGVDYLVHPAPLYDSAFNVLWFGALIALRDQPFLQNGNLLKLAIGGYAVFRFAIEFVRNNDVLAFGLTPQQYACLLTLGALAIYYVRRRQLAWR